MSANPPSDQSSVEPSDEEKDDKKTDIQKAKEAQEKAYQEETSEEGKFLNTAFIFGGSVGLALAQENLIKVQAFEKFKRITSDKNFGHHLLKVVDTSGFNDIKANYATVSREVRRQRDKNPKRGYTEVSVGPFKNTRIGYDEFDRSSGAFQIGDAVQNRVRADALKIKFANAQQIYGLDPQHATEFKQGFAKWLKNNPGRTIDDADIYLLTQSKTVYKDQYKKEPDKPDEKGRELIKRNQSAQTEAATSKQNAERIIRGQKVIKRSLDTGQSILSENQIKEGISYTIRGEIAAPISYPLEVPVTQAQPIIQPSVAPTTLPPSIPPLTIPSIQPSSALGIRQRFLGALSKSVIGQSAKSAVSSITGFLGKKAAISAALKLGISALAGTATGGIATAAQLGLKLGKALFTAIGEKLPIIGDFIKNIGKAFDLPGKAIKYAALAAVLAIVGIFILILFFASGSTSNLPTLTSANSIIVPTKKEEVSARNWPDFEKSVLGALDTNGHD